MAVSLAPLLENENFFIHFLILFDKFESCYLPFGMEHKNYLIFLSTNIFYDHCTAQEEFIGMSFISPFDG